MNDTELLQHLSSQQDPLEGASVKLASFEYQDYIDDVLAEYFDIVNILKTIDEDNGVYVLHFGQISALSTLNSALAGINKFYN
ncbi:hypothetical protein [uncultured Microbulbifer sp.]|uniref:hypothetical protein n=1 Tax=uncultured Microbulbifer sp. TaxID=348147 RepID=UPI0026320595|nr:hypothetical protein [uncultured Microbulbifer sp.]